MFYLALAALVYAILAAGRMVSVHVPFRREQFSLATAWCAGYGLFCLWWLAGEPLLGAGPWMTPLGFGLAVGLLAGALYQNWHTWPREQHQLSHVIAALLMSLPLVGLLWGALPAGASFWQESGAALWLSQSPLWPGPQQLPAMLLPAVPGWLPLLLPLSTFGDIAQPPLVMLYINLGCLLAASGVLLVALNWPIKWSNLPLVAAGGLLVVLLLNPWLPLLRVGDTAAQIPAALCLFVAALPLLNPMPLSSGLTSVGASLSLVALTMLHPLGWLLSLWVAMVYKLRMLAEGVTSPDHARRHALALTLLLTLPAIAWAAWQWTLHPFGTAVAPLLVQPVKFFHAVVAQVPAAPAEPLPWLATLLAVVAGLRPIWGRSAVGGRVLMTTYAPFIAPLLLALPPLALVLWAGPMRLPLVLEVFQFILLMPLVAWAAQGYRHSVWRERLYRAPWTYGCIFSIGVFAAVLALSKPVLQMPTPWALVAGDIKQYPLVLAVGLDDAAVLELNYRAAGRTHVLPMPEGQRREALALLREHPLPLLVAAPALPGLGFGVSAAAPLMLFQPAAGGATLLNKWNVTP